MAFRDDDLAVFSAEGAWLPEGGDERMTGSDGATIWNAAFGSGPAVVLLHGGLGHSGNWGHQVSPLVDAGYQVIAIDSRGHGRSTRDERPYSYELLAGDVLAVLDARNIEQAAFIGWSDGACTALVLADHAPQRSRGVFFFACNMDPSGTKEIEFGPLLQRCIGRHVKDYQALSATPDDFEAFSSAVGEMQRTQPNYAADDLARIAVPVAIVQAENDEFIKREHAEYLARTIPGATFTLLPSVSHFAPLQRPDEFNREVLKFLRSFES
jgi:non-heme chloroperoxidase